ncbi:ammosamide/lymphostin RiPP family protein [Actinoplanes siamensis]
MKIAPNRLFDCATGRHFMTQQVEQAELIQPQPGEELEDLDELDELDDLDGIEFALEEIENKIAPLALA